MNKTSNSVAVNYELTARVLANGNRKNSRKPVKKDRTALIAGIVLAVIPVSIFALQALGIINCSSY